MCMFLISGTFDQILEIWMKAFIVFFMIHACFQFTYAFTCGTHSVSYGIFHEFISVSCGFFELCWRARQGQVQSTVVLTVARACGLKRYLVRIRWRAFSSCLVFSIFLHIPCIVLLHFFISFHISKIHNKLNNHPKMMRFFALYSLSCLVFFDD